MSNPRAITLWGGRAGELSRVWVCGRCGAKVYCGRLTATPACRCTCGHAIWLPGNGAPPPGKRL
jgi:DNA-directed RNA polymerase subunit RPC12/RpoP